MLVKQSQVHRHLTQRCRVVSIDGVGFPLRARSATAGGAGNNLIFDDRFDPPVVRGLLVDECLQVQGHDPEVSQAVEEAAPGDDQRQAGLAGRGVAVPVATEAARRVLAGLTHAGSPSEDRCGGGKH
jgi:hypothetical protein